MRGKPGYKLLTPIQPGITPAHAGKTKDAADKEMED